VFVILLWPKPKLYGVFVRFRAPLRGTDADLVSSSPSSITANHRFLRHDDSSTGSTHLPVKQYALMAAVGTVR
jgi:hypothetical protein